MSTAERFEEYHAANPIVYDTLRQLAREWVAAHGRRKVGIRMLWETARWQIIMHTNDTEYKMNDHYTSYYARLLQMNDLVLDGLFELRSSPADSWAEAKLAARRQGSA